jgi:hypothetical protein
VSRREGLDDDFEALLADLELHVLLGDDLRQPDPEAVERLRVLGDPALRRLVDADLFRRPVPAGVGGRADVDALALTLRGFLDATRCPTTPGLADILTRGRPRLPRRGTLAPPTWRPTCGDTSPI